MVKLLSQDPNWRNLTALNYHYWTQPLPSWVGWYANLLPEWFQKFSTAGMFAIEIVVPFFIFFPKRFRLIAFWMMVILQILIMLTGNYAFFNLLTIALCLLLVDDEAWRRKMISVTSAPSQTVRPIRAYYLIGAYLFILSCLHFSVSMRFWTDWPKPLVSMYQRAVPFLSVNGYGLFARMTTQRDEIIMEGSDDGQNWKTYEFKYKPGDLNRRPAFVEPHQPRLDWQMWFAALSSYENNQWFLAFCYRLLEGSPSVVSLLEKNPFPQKPPKYVRALLYEYHFSDLPMHRKDGLWWQSAQKGLYCPVLTLQSGPNGKELYAVSP